jgi:hypothetical protein
LRTDVNAISYDLILDRTVSPFYKGWFRPLPTRFEGMLIEEERVGEMKNSR